MTIYEILPWLAAVSLVAFTTVRMAAGPVAGSAAWMFPAALSAGFLAWSVWAVASAGPFGFWAVHTRNVWGNQVWFDLLLAVGVAWTLILPQAKALKMRLAPWLLFILCTGCIGLLAMIARTNYLAVNAESGPAQTAR